jgi:hypothetical protein
MFPRLVYDNFAAYPLLWNGQFGQNAILYTGRGRASSEEVSQVLDGAFACLALRFRFIPRHRFPQAIPQLCLCPPPELRRRPRGV